MQSWAEEELKYVQLGDERLNKRLIKMVETFAGNPAWELAHSVCPILVDTQTTVCAVNHYPAMSYREIYNDKLSKGGKGGFESYARIIPTLYTEEPDFIVIVSEI